MRKKIPAARRPVAAIAILAAGSTLVPAVAQAPSLAMLDGLERGQWQLRFRDGGAVQRICIGSGRDLIQVRHPNSKCSRYVVEDGSTEVTVQYTCRGSNYGRTSIRRETATLAQLKSQGIADGLPFQFTAEARRTGSCS